MFQSVSQAEAYFYSIAHYNRHVGEYVVLTMHAIQKFSGFF